MRGVLVAIASLALAGSAAAEPISDAAVASLTTGVTTYSEVKSRFGTPSATQSMDGGLAVAYVVSSTRVKAATLIPFVDLFAGGATSTNKTFGLLFDARGVLVRVAVQSVGVDCKMSLVRDECSSTSSAPSAPSGVASGGGTSLGVQTTDMSPAMSTMIGRPGLRAALIQSVSPGSVAEKGGLAQGDIVMTYAGKTISGALDLVAAVHATKPGDAVVLEIVRGGKDQALNLSF